MIQRAIEVNRSYLRNLKWNFVVVGLCRCPGFRWRSRFTRTRFSSTFGAFTRATACTGRTAEQLHRFADHPQLAPLLCALFVVPSIQLETAFDENRPALLQIFAGDFSKTRPEDNIDNCDFFAFFTAVH